MLGALPKNLNNIFGIVQFEHPHPHPRYPKKPFLAHGVQRYGCLGRHPRTQTMFFGIVHCKRLHPRYPKTPLLAQVCRGMGAWGTTQEPKQYFLGSSNAPIVSKNTFSGPWCAEGWVFGAPPQNPNNDFWYCPLSIPGGIQKHLFFLAHGVQRYGCLGRHPRTQTIFFGIVQFKSPHPRYPKTPFQTHGLQRNGCLGRHPSTQTIFFGIAHFKHPHPRYPKTPYMAHGVQRYGCLGRHPRT